MFTIQTKSFSETLSLSEQRRLLSILLEKERERVASQPRFEFAYIDRGDRVEAAIEEGRLVERSRARA